MGYLQKMVASYSDTLTDDINEELFDRRKGKQVYEYIIDDLRSIEMLPNISLRNIEYITDPSKLDVRLNQNNIKSKKIIKQKIEKLIPIHQTAFDALKFTVQIGPKHSVENLILIPKYIDRYHFLVNGNKTLVMFQVVDTAIYNQKGSVILKPRVQSEFTRNNKKRVTLMDSVTGETFKVDTMSINVFKKTFDPLYYFVAKKGVLGTIDYFGYSRFLDVVTEATNPDLFYYFKINSNIMLEVEKKLFNMDNFFRIFTGMFIGIFNSRNKIDDIYNQEVWVKRLGSLFTSSTKNQPNKGVDVLRSFKNVLDATTQDILRTADKDKHDIYAVTRWILREFNTLRNTDNNDLKNRRIRSNEYIAAYFGRVLKNKVNYALNMGQFDPDKLMKIFKFDEYVLFKELFGGVRACPLFRYNMDINDLQALNGLKFSITGIQALPSKRIKDEQRDLHPSHIGRFELNAISPSSPGASGMLTPFCKIYEGGYFADDSTVWKGNYEKKFKKRIKEIKSDEDRYLILRAHRQRAKHTHDRRQWAFSYSAIRGEDGYIRIRRPKYVRNENGYIKLTLRPQFIPYVRNDKGYIELKRRTNNRPRIVPKPKSKRWRLVPR